MVMIQAADPADWIQVETPDAEAYVSKETAGT